MSLSRRAFAGSLAGTALLKGQGQSPAREPSAATETAGSPAPGAWTPKLFDPHQLATVAAVAELIIPATDTPGAREARVHEHLNEILSASPASAQHAFLEGLSWLDGYCLRMEKSPFVGLSAARQMDILSQLHESSGTASEPGRKFVQSMKHWTATIYYSTEIGVQELNKGERVPASYARECS